MPTSASLLELTNVSVRYGMITAARNVDLKVAPGETLTILGANGAGKSSLLKAISGLVALHEGAIHLSSKPLHGLRPHKISAAGISHVPEGRRVIAPLSVTENLVLAAQAVGRCSAKEAHARAAEIFAMFPRLQERQTVAAGLLSGGEQQMLAIGRGIVARPQVLLVDEPSMGLAPIMVREIYDAFRSRTGVATSAAILLAEQSSELALAVADKAVVLSRGSVVFEGPSRDVTKEIIHDAYLGSAASVRSITRRASG